MYLLKNHNIPAIEKLAVYRRQGGYTALAKAKEAGAESVVDLIDRSGLRGRGGGAFPTATKMRAVLQNERYPHYFVCNIAEGEPGSFKDHALLKNPHQILEATAIASLAIRAERAFIYLRGSFVKEEQLLNAALLEAKEDGLIPVEIVVHRGEDAYIAGEETAMLESLEGKQAIPRTKPPRPAEYGLWDSPTVVNNVETICNLIYIINEGVDAFRKFGTPESPGAKLFCLSGQIRNPGLYELPLGVSLFTLLNQYGGGPRDGRKLVAVFPGGPSTPLLPLTQDVPLDFESLKNAGTALGTGGMIVIDDSKDLLDLAVEITGFFARESCGTCPPCTLGTAGIHQALVDFKASKGKDPQKAIREYCDLMKFRGNCAHGRSAALTVQSLMQYHPEVFQAP